MHLFQQALVFYVLQVAFKTLFEESFHWSIREDGVYFFLADKVILSTFADGIGKTNIFNSFGYNRGENFLPFLEEFNYGFFE